MEEVHRELAQQFHVPPVASTQLERACYVVAFERWSQHQEQVLPDVAPLEEPELQLMLLQEFASRLHVAGSMVMLLARVARAWASVSTS